MTLHKKKVAPGTVTDQKKKGRVPRRRVKTTAQHNELAHEP
jgi:hypothetical protein